MARCYCRWRNVLVCLCTPCIIVALLMVYGTVIICMSMQGAGTSVPVTKPVSPLFVASGNLRSKNFAPFPKTFWDLYPNGDAIWNRLQMSIDRHFNPILHPRNTRKGFEHSNIHESLLRESFFVVNKLDSMHRHIDGLPPQLKNFVKNMHRRDYTTVLQPDEVCGAGENDETDPVLLLLAIKTKQSNFKNRQAIRQTWGQVGWVAGQKGSRSREEESGGYVRRVFLLGKEENEELGVNFSELLQMESLYYGDILQWDFNDTFFNLTLKDVLFWRWFSHFCKRTLFVFKGDDDVFVNTQNMIMYLHDQLRKPQANEIMKEFMVGEVIRAATPHRVNESKYFIPDSFYKGHYPVYAGGGGVVYSGLLVQRLYNMSTRVHLFPIDDVYVGMCMNRLNAHPVHHPAFLTFDFPEKEEEQLCSYHTILLVHKRSPSEVIRLWTDMKKTQGKCRDVPLREDVQTRLKPKL